MVDWALSPVMALGTPRTCATGMGVHAGPRTSKTSGSQANTPHVEAATARRQGNQVESACPAASEVWLPVPPGVAFTLGLAPANKDQREGLPELPENAEGESEPPLPRVSQSAPLGP